MALTLLTRMAKGTDLTYADIDNNWALLMEAFAGGAAGGQRLYAIVNTNTANACQNDGSNNLNITGALQIVTPPVRPMAMHYIVTLNGVIAAIGDLADYWVGAAFPFTEDYTGGEAFNEVINIPSADYPATLMIYLWDEQGNYANPVSITLQDNPCEKPAESIVISAASVIGGVLEFTIVLANGSNDYQAQYWNGSAWVSLGNFVQADTGGASVIINTAVSGTHNFRVVDTLTLNTSNTLSVNF